MIMMPTDNKSSIVQIDFRRATGTDIEEVFRMYKAAITEMERHNIMQWDDIYPDKPTLESDIANKEMYIGCIGNKIASAYVINRQCDDEYKNGNWKYADSSYSVVHRLCVSPEFQNKGVGKRTMEHIEHEALANGSESIRLDCFTLNPFACNMYRRLGYRIAGYATWRKGVFYLMEKRL